MAAPTITPGRIVLMLGNIIYSGGAFIADWNETHIHNPNWPPHARFHNGQTMSLGVCLAAASIYFTFRPAFSGSTISAEESILAAAVIGSFYCFAGVTAILYPGSAWCDKEYPNGNAQMYIFPVIIAIIWGGYFLEASRLAGGKGKIA